MTTIAAYYHFLGAVSHYCGSCRRFANEQHYRNWLAYMERTYPTFILDEVYR